MYDYAEFVEALNARTPHTFSMVNTGGGCMCLIAEAVAETPNHVFDICIGGYDGPLPARADLVKHSRFGVELVERGRDTGMNGYYTETRHIVATGITVDELVDAVNAHPTSLPPMEATMPETTVTVRLILEHSPSYPTRHVVDEQFTHTDPVVALARAYRHARALMGGRGPDVPHWLIWPQPYGWSLDTMDNCQYAVDVITGSLDEWQRRDDRLTELRIARHTA